MSQDSKERVIIKNDKIKILFANEWRVVDLEKYKEFKKISSGANGVTLVGRNRRTLRIDCIKIYTPNPKNINNEVSVEQYLREVRKLALMNDPQIVTIYDAFDTEDGFHVVTMEYIEGITLKQWLKEKVVFNESQDYIDRLHIAKQVLDTVIRYQEKGILHGDLHLNNILVDFFDKIHIIDFGTSYFGGHNKTQERESFFVYDLVRRILGSYFDEKYFTVQCPNCTYERKIMNDVREKYPVLITKTMLSYVNSMDLILQLPTDSLKLSNIIDLCAELTNGVYFNFDYIIKMIWSKVFNKKIIITKVGQIIFDNIDANITPDELSLEQGMALQVDLIETYYQLMLSTREKWNLENIKKSIIDKYKTLNDDKIDAYINTLMEANEPTYYEFMCCDTTYNRLEDQDYKVIMYEALLVCLGELSLYSKLWEIINERRWEQELKKIKLNESSKL